MQVKVQCFMNTLKMTFHHSRHDCFYSRTQENNKLTNEEGREIEKVHGRDIKRTTEKKIHADVNVNEWQLSAGEKRLACCYVPVACVLSDNTWWRGV